MFPLVHIYVATKVAKKKTPLLVIGSVIPDMVWVDRKNLKPEFLHDNIDDFYSYLELNQKDLLDLAMGMKLHSNAAGADKYSHFYKGGYSYVKGKVLIPDLLDLVDSNEDKKVSDLSHNFIEAALDIDLLKDKPEVLNLYKKSVLSVDFNKVSKAISDYSKINYALIDKAIHTVIDLVNPESFVSAKSIAEDVLPKLIKLSFGKDVDSERVLEILQHAVDITNKDYEIFTQEMISEIKKDFPEFN